jgi:hypothetical protein
VTFKMSLGFLYVHRLYKVLTLVPATNSSYVDDRVIFDSCYDYHLSVC